MVLAVLKIIGIVLGSIIGLVILLLLLALCVPVRYCVDAEKKEEPFCTRGRLSWLFGILSFQCGYQKQTASYKFRLFGIQIFPRSPYRNESGKSTADPKKPNQTTGTKQSKQAEKKAKPKPERKQISHNIRRILQELKDPDKKEMLLECKNTAILLLKHLKPRRICGTVCFGLESPDQTALVYGVAANLAAAIDRHLLLIPDMQEKTFSFDVRIKGRIFAGYLLFLLVRLLRNPGLRDFARQQLSRK